MSSLPAIAQSRASQLRARAADPARDAPATTPSNANRSAAASFATLLDARLAADRAAKTRATQTDTHARHTVDDAMSASSTALPPREADLGEADLGEADLGDADLGDADLATGARDAGGNAATADQDIARGTGGGAIGDVVDTDAAVNAAAGDATTAAAATAAAIAAAAAGPARPTHDTDHDMDAVAPELRDRVARVVERMRDEFGIEVDVTEGYRTQARQNSLHAQGRTAPGPVVTWTRNSRHTMGRAVDVTVNGGYSDTRGFATLQRVAREEGLHTLGLRDPGHLELPASVAGSARPAAMAGAMGGVDLATLAQLAGDAGARVESVAVDVDGGPLPLATPARTAGTAAAAGTATVATVARVARVANVARVARVATPGVATVGATGATGAAGATGATGAAATVEGGRNAVPAGANTSGAAALAAAAGGQPAPRARAEPTRDDRSGEVGDATSGGHGGDNGALFGGDGSRDRGSLPGAARMAPVTGAATADALTRLDRIDALRDGSAARPLSHLTLMLDNAAGGSDRIRVDVRGSQMGAVLELSDPVLRDRVSSNLGELQHALEQRGLQSDGLQVRRAGIGATATDSLDMSRVAGATLERENVRAGGNANPGQSSTQHRERDDRQHPDGPWDDSSPRQRPRREPKENDK
ncbi:MAG: hypothetical protein ACYC2G_05765 [Gemmatimonadaceae bacterium]